MKRLIISFLVFAFACSKPDVTAPMISVISPEPNEFFSANQTIMVKATINDNSGIHMVHVIVVDDAGGHWVHSEEHVEGKTYEVNKTFIAMGGKTYTIHIDAADHNENTAQKEIIVSVH